jgi:hypothetical protein
LLREALTTTETISRVDVVVEALPHAVAAVIRTQVASPRRSVRVSWIRIGDLTAGLESYGKFARAAPYDC